MEAGLILYGGLKLLIWVWAIRGILLIANDILLLFINWLDS